MSATADVSMEQRAAEVLAALQRRYPNPHPNLAAASPWQLLVATILAAQCTDARVNQLTPPLFARWPDAKALSQATLPDIEEMIKQAGFFRAKARYLLASAQRLEAVYNGVVPKTLEDLMTLPGVARKTANVVLYGAYGINAGLAVDTHVKRISYRLGLTDSHDPKRIERDLMALFPQEEWGGINHRMVLFGRDVCRARTPGCATCEVQSVCLQRVS